MTGEINYKRVCVESKYGAIGYALINKLIKRDMISVFKIHFFYKIGLSRLQKK